MPPQSALIKIVAAIVLSVVAWVINPFYLVSIAAIVASVLGCVEWAKAKGLSPLFGALGLIWIIGYIILFLIPGKATAGFAGDANSNYPR